MIAGRLRNVWQGEPAPAAATEQQVSLLAPRLRPPRLSGSLITRQRLLARLDEGLERKLTVLSAPAGFGKTTLVSQWITRHQISPDGSLQPPFPVAWVSLESGDNDTTRFWHDVITACQIFRANLGTDALALLHTTQSSWHPSLLEDAQTMLLNDLTLLPGRGVLVLEDYHTVTTARIHKTLASFIEHLPPSLHMVLMTRSNPPLPLARWRAEGQLIEVSASDLCFSEDEIVSFLQQITPFTLSSEEMERLLERTEGWGVGLRLLALALQGHMMEQEIETVLANFSGDHGHLLEYFIGKVLNAQPEPMQRFLLQTSLLASLNSSLCDAVTGRTDSEQWLATVEHSGLFLVPLEHTSERWYRYHTLFAEAMQHEAHRRLGEEELHARFYRASTWYEQHEMLAEAINAALAGADFTRAACLIGNLMGAPSQLGMHEISSVHGWLERVPEQVFREQPVLALTSAIVHVFTADRYPPAVTPLIDERLQCAERTWTQEDASGWVGRLTAFRALLEAWQERLPEAAAFASRALTSLPEDDYEWRGICSKISGEVAQVAGSSDLAPQPALLDNPLSQQEIRVLRLLASGHTHQEIADELAVSMNTVKKHLKRIYHKLDVTSHERACEVAHNLHLL
jgi:LuxR family maltose regulon positive regulatory protein